ncbi:MAG: hypothetical protein ACLR8Y_02320 [Alistipes indistinctus]
MKQSGLDPNMVFAMMNNGRNNSGFGDGAWFLWIIVILALFRGGLWGGNGNGASEAAGNANGCGLLANYLATGNQSALSELSATLHCDVKRIARPPSTRRNPVLVQSVGNQVGLTRASEVINAPRRRWAAAASPRSSPGCCCDIRASITRHSRVISSCNSASRPTQLTNAIATT